MATRFEDDFAIDPAAVEAAITPRTKALFLGYPCNPTGAVLPPDVQDALAEIAVRHDLLVYSDEIYDRLAYGDYTHRAMSALPGMRERTILMGGFSKAYAMTGWRVGYVAAPAAILEGIVKVHQYGIMSAPTTAQDAALVAVIEGEPDVERMRAEYDRRRRLIVDGLNALGLETFEPRGAFYAFPRITSTGLTDEAFTEGLLTQERVAVVPGAPSGRRAPAMCACATRPRTSGWRRRSGGSAGSSSTPGPPDGQAGGTGRTRQTSVSSYSIAPVRARSRSHQPLSLTSRRRPSSKSTHTTPKRCV